MITQALQQETETLYNQTDALLLLSVLLKEHKRALTREQINGLGNLLQTTAQVQAGALNNIRNLPL
jgi:hypothetical protein